MFEYDFISFDIRIPSKISTVFTFNSNTPAKILQSCNGLLLCYIDHSKYYYVYNPFTNMSKMLPRPKIYVQPHIIVGGIRLVFDPTKSPHYKVVHAGIKTDDNFDDFEMIIDFIMIVWFHGFEAGIYSNGALHWLNFTNRRYWHAKLNILVGNLVLRTRQLPVTLDGELFCDPKFFESRGCLLLVCKDDPDSRQLNIFEMRNGYSEWSPKYLINLDDIMTPLPQNWVIYSSVWRIVLGEREEDSFMVIKSYEKVLQYKIVLKTVHTLFEMESTSPHESFSFIASFAHVLNVKVEAVEESDLASMEFCLSFVSTYYISGEVCVTASSELPGPSEVDISGEGRGSKKLITDTRVNLLTSSANAVLSNDDLLIEILLLLPAISLLFYKSISKQWLSVITCPAFTLRLSQKPNVDPPCGLFVWGPKRKIKRNMFEYDFISFDIRIPSKISNVFTFSSKAPDKILQSCNGLLLCYIKPDKFFVYSPCVNLFKMLPRPQIYVQPQITFGGIRLVFDPTKSPHYKVVRAGLKTHDDFNDLDGGDFYIQIETYSSETG
ncbi:retrovirus-related pol polyprotein from transposon TNT 1-94, partial [Tanacetum coccineum]